MLDMWETLCDLLHKTGKRIDEWGFGDRKKTVKDMTKTTFEAIEEALGKKFKSVDKKRCSTLADLIFAELIV
ncbi:hypothetical protein MHBO_000829 [Bonamia ostreae]|uniref:Uncharacterized protein n=1 Tax=Bonamia ostreae TaxID=126728 RepID=A0ABV2AHN2_9EUKA